MRDKINSTLTNFLAISLTSISALGITTSSIDLSQQFFTPEVAPIISFNEGGNNTDTIQLHLPESKRICSSNYDRMRDLFDGELRDFTEEENEEYNKVLDSIYKPTGLNIFDLC